MPESNIDERMDSLNGMTPRETMADIHNLAEAIGYDDCSDLTVEQWAAKADEALRRSRLAPREDSVLSLSEPRRDRDLYDLAALLSLAPPEAVVFDCTRGFRWRAVRDGGSTVWEALTRQDNPAENYPRHKGLGLAELAPLQVEAWPRPATSVAHPVGEEWEGVECTTDTYEWLWEVSQDGGTECAAPVPLCIFSFLARGGQLEARHAAVLAEQWGKIRAWLRESETGRGDAEAQTRQAQAQIRQLEAEKAHWRMASAMPAAADELSRISTELSDLVRKLRQPQEPTDG